jgi:hypothetical protein
LQFVDGLLETDPAAKRSDELHGRAECCEGRDTEHLGVVKIEDAFVGIFGKQRI